MISDQTNTRQPDVWPACDDGLVASGAGDPPTTDPLRFYEYSAAACRTNVRGHLGLRISDSESKKPSNVRMRLVDILTFNGSPSRL
jgi:hypothetical protein